LLKSTQQSAKPDQPQIWQISADQKQISREFRECTRIKTKTRFGIFRVDSRLIFLISVHQRKSAANAFR
jgi:hypothetical protein